MKRLKALVLMVIFIGPITAMAGDGEIELVEQMRSLNYFLHKTHLSLQAGNIQLASFYSHELEEVAEVVEQVASYDGFSVGQLSKAMLVPRLEQFEKSLKSNDLQAAKTDFDALINSCNSCHQATDHGYIRIEKNDHNPYMQSFQAE